MTLLERMDRLPVTRYHKILWIVCTAAWFFDGYVTGIPAFSVALSFKQLGFNVVTSAATLGASGIGILIGSYALAYLADRWGRRTIFQFDIGLYALGSFLAIFSPVWWYMFCCFVLMGTGIGGLYSVDNAYIAEYFPPKNRGFWQSAMLMTFVPGLMLAGALPLLAPIAPTLFGLPFGWRILPLVGAIPAVVVFAVRRTLPESVRFLLSRGKVDEAAKVVEKLEASAGSAYKYTGAIQVPQLEHVGKANPRVFFKREYIKYTIPFWFGWMVLFAFTNTPSNYLPTVFMIGLGGGAVTLLTTVLIMELNLGIGQLICRGFAWFTIDTKHGRRLNLMVGSIVPAIGLALWAYPWMHRTTVNFWYLAIPGMMVVWGNTWFMAFSASSVELYPVEARSMAYGWGSGLGRIMQAAGPLFMAALLVHIDYYFYFGAIAWAIIALMCWAWIPETSRVKIEESSKDKLLLGEVEVKK